MGTYLQISRPKINGLHINRIISKTTNNLLIINKKTKNLAVVALNYILYTEQNKSLKTFLTI
jgi:hypothetical protein